MIAAIILAAGPSSRMGQSKQLLDVGGELLLVKTIQTVLRAGLQNVTVVLGANEHAHREVMKDLPVDVVTNPDWKRGMGSSIKTGLNDILSRHPGTDAVIIFVCDQPMLSDDIIKNIIQKHTETKKPVIASEYSNVPGVPVLFDKSYFEVLMKLPDSEGAKKIILKNPGDVTLVPFAGGEVDLDTMADYEAYKKSHSAS